MSMTDSLPREILWDMRTCPPMNEPHNYDGIVNVVVLIPTHKVRSVTARIDSSHLRHKSVTDLWIGDPVAVFLIRSDSVTEEGEWPSTISRGRVAVTTVICCKHFIHLPGWRKIRVNVGWIIVQLRSVLENYDSHQWNANLRIIFTWKFNWSPKLKYICFIRHIL